MENISERPRPGCVHYELGKDERGFDLGHVELYANGEVGFWTGDRDPMDVGAVMSSEQLPILREVVLHLERGGFE